MVHSLTGDSTKNSKGGSSQGDPSGKTPTLKAWEGSRLKMVGLDALPTYNAEVVWFPVPVEFIERYFQQLHRQNWETDTAH
jgi:catalase (peroxidase I)